MRYQPNEYSPLKLRDSEFVMNATMKYVRWFFQGTCNVVLTFCRYKYTNQSIYISSSQYEIHFEEII